MKNELLLILITGFVVINIYHDGKYSKMIMKWKKHFQIGGVIFFALSVWIFLKKYPKESGNLAQHLNGMIKYAPIDKNSADIISPFLKMSAVSAGAQAGAGANSGANSGSGVYNHIPPQQKRMMRSGGNSNKRSVSQQKKKYVAAQQGWKCNDCECTLDAWFDIDHKHRLDQGGTNHISNLVALCKNCHGKKTWMETMNSDTSNTH